MTEGFEVTIKYRGKKHDQVASPATASSEFAILRKDLAHLRVHSPSQKNVHRVGGAFILRWPTAGTGSKVVGLADSLHTRWFRLCSDDPEALKLRGFLSIESITLTQDGVRIRSTTDPSTLTRKLPKSASEGAHDPKPSLPPPPRVPRPAPRLDQAPPQLKRRMSDAQGPPNPTRQRLEGPEVPATAIHHVEPPTADPRRPRVSRDDARPGEPKTPAGSPPPREPGEMTPRSSAPTPQPGPESGPLAAASPGDANDADRRRSRDVTRLSREFWDTRRQLTALQAREQVILDDLERLGARPEGSPSNADRHTNSVVVVARDEMLRLEAEVRAERARRVRVEQALSDVERECRAPFVVPALFRALLDISDLSS